MPSNIIEADNCTIGQFSVLDKHLCMMLIHTGLSNLHLSESAILYIFLKTKKTGKD